MFTSFVLARRSDTSKCFAQVHRELFAPFAGHTQKVVERWRPQPYCGWVTRVTPKPSLLPWAEEYFCASGFFSSVQSFEMTWWGSIFSLKASHRVGKKKKSKPHSDGVICIQWEKRFQVEGRAEKGRNLLTDLFRAKGTRLGGGGVEQLCSRGKVHQFAARNCTNDLVEHAKFDFYEPSWQIPTLLRGQTTKMNSYVWEINTPLWLAVKRQAFIAPSPLWQRLNVFKSNFNAFPRSKEKRCTMKPKQLARNLGYWCGCVATTALTTMTELRSVRGGEIYLQLRTGSTQPIDGVGFLSLCAGCFGSLRAEGNLHALPELSFCN